MPLISRALRIGLHLVAPTERPPLEDDAWQEAAAREGAPRARIRQQASKPVRPITKLRRYVLWLSGVEGKMPISFSCLRG